MSVLPEIEVVRPRPGAAVVECRGEHDLVTSEALGELLACLVTDNELVVIDVTEAEFIDSSFLLNLLATDRLARSQGSQVRLQLGTAPIVRRALEVGGILELVEHFPTRDKALAQHEEL